MRAVSEAGAAERGMSGGSMSANSGQCRLHVIVINKSGLPRWRIKAMQSRKRWCIYFGEPVKLAGRMVLFGWPICAG